jgi:hypothetical protein
MESALRLQVMIGDDRVVHLPKEFPTGSAEVIVLIASSADRPDRSRLLGRLAGRATMAEDFDAPLPEDVLRDFEGT